MRLVRIAVENYKAFADRAEIDFTLGGRDPERPVFLIGGMNGAGKTSLLEALNIALYGESRDRVFQSLNRRMLATGKADATFEVHLEDETGQPIIARRVFATQPTFRSPRAEDLEERPLEVRVGDQVIRNAGRVWQDFVESRLPRGITQFVFFDGEKIQDLAADDHSEAKLRESIEAVLGIEPVRKLLDDLKNLRKVDQRDYVALDAADVSDKEDDLVKLRRSLERLEKKREEAEAAFRADEREAEDLKQRFEQTFGFPPGAESDLRRRQQRAHELSRRVGEVEQEVRSLVENRLPLTLMRPHFDALRDQLQRERTVAGHQVLKDSAAELAAAIARELPEPTMPCCGTVPGPEVQERLRARIERALSSFGRPDPGDLLHGLSGTAAARVEERLSGAEADWVGRLKARLEERATLRRDLRDLEKAAEQLTLATGSRSQFEEWSRDLESLNQQIGRKRQQRDQLDEQVDEAKKKIATAEHEQFILRNKHDQARRHGAYLDMVTQTIELLSDYVGALRKRKLADLRQRTFEMFGRLAAKGDLVSAIDIDPATYAITVRDRSGQAIRKADLSAGEKEIFAISLIWGLGQAARRDLPIVIDTPLSRLDSAHRDALIQHYLPGAGHQVIVLSTDTEVDQHYYRLLAPHIQHAVRLRFDPAAECSVPEPGYFWTGLAHG